MGEKILLVQVSEPETSQIRKLADNKGICVNCVMEENYGCTLSELECSSKQKPAEQKAGVRLPAQSLIIFCNVTPKHFDKFLFELRSKEILVDFKAVLTETNRNWTLERLYMELIRERIAFKR